MQMKRIALDTNAVNKIAEFPGLIDKIHMVAERGLLLIIRIPMIRAEIENTRDATRRDLLTKTWASLLGKDVRTRGGYWGVGLRWGESIWGDGGDTGLPLSESRTKGRGGAGDAIIATTAAGEADVLVTDDAAVESKVRSSGVQCEIWSFQQFVDFVQVNLV